MNADTKRATIVEVGPRDGFQSVLPFIETTTKIRILEQLHSAGVRRVEATSFVSASAVPQLADAAEVLAAAQSLPGLDTQVLIPTARHAGNAIAAGARHLVFVLSVSDRHNRSNVRRTQAESIEEYRRIVADLPAEAKIRLNVATAFDCPYGGAIPESTTIELLDTLIDIMPSAEIGLCDTTGRVSPSQVGSLFGHAMKRFPQAGAWAFHAHDTYGLGAANSLAAWNAGVAVFDASIAGLGGCPFAPGATGNVATEDLQWMFEGMGIATGLDLAKLVEVAKVTASLPGAQAGGRVRNALRSRPCEAS